MIMMMSAGRRVCGGHRFDSDMCSLGQGLGLRVYALASPTAPQREMSWLLHVCRHACILVLPILKATLHLQLDLREYHQSNPWPRSLISHVWRSWGPFDGIAGLCEATLARFCSQVVIHISVEKA